RGEPDQETGFLSPLDPGVLAAEVDAGRTEHDRSVDVIVDDEGDTGAGTEVAKRLPLLDPLDGRDVLEPQLDECRSALDRDPRDADVVNEGVQDHVVLDDIRSEEHTSELQSLTNLVCRLLLEKKNNIQSTTHTL